MSDKKYRYCYSTVGYGVFSLLGERYRMGRIEVFDREDESGYQVHEGFYCMPFEAADKFEEWIEGLQTDLPIHFDIGSVEWCNEECARELNIDPKLMHDPETKKEYYSKKNDAYARERGYIDWNDLLKHSKWVDKGDQKISDTEDKLLGGPQDTRDERVIDPDNNKTI